MHELFAKVGSFYPLPANFRLTPEAEEKFTEKLRLDSESFAGSKVDEVVRKDGLQLLLNDGSRICYRLSGTESVVRVYSEAPRQQQLQKLSTSAEQWIFE